MSAHQVKSHEIPLPRRIFGKVVFLGFVEGVSRGVFIEGRKNLPKKRPHIIAYNHLGWLEGLLPYILHSVEDWPFTITKIETVQHGLGRLLTPFGFIGIKRGELDMIAIRKALEVLKKGGIIATALEGTRGRGDARLLPKDPKTGVIFLADKFNPPLPIVPMAVWGQNEDTFPLIDVEGIHIEDFMKLRKSALHVKIGEPFIPVFQAGQPLSHSEMRHSLAAQLGDRIQVLLPPERRSEQPNLS